VGLGLKFMGECACGLDHQNFFSEAIRRLGLSLKEGLLGVDQRLT
jgi:hypothetical protein